MLQFNIFCLILLFSLVNCQSAAQDEFVELPGLEKFAKVRLTERNFERVRTMHVNWFAAGLKALIGNMGRALFLQLDKKGQVQLAKCLDQIDDRKDLVLSANCLIKARKRKLLGIGSEEKKVTPNSLETTNSQKVALHMNNIVNAGMTAQNGTVEKKTYPPEVRQPPSLLDLIKNIATETLRSAANSTIINSNTKKQIKLLRKRAAAAAASFHGNSSNSFAKKPMQQRRKHIILSSQTTAMQDWTKRLRRFRENLHKSKEKDAMKKKKQSYKSKWAIYREAMKPKIEIRQAESLEQLRTEQDRSAIVRLSNLISMLNGRNASETAAHAKWTRMYDTLVRLKRANDKRRAAPGALVYEKRMYDLVLGKEKPTLGPTEKLGPQGLLQLGLSLFDTLRNGTAHKESNYKLMSPRVAPLMPDKADAVKSILSRYRPLYSPCMNLKRMMMILKASGLNKQDRDALLHSLMELSGSVGHIQEAMDLLKALNFFEIEPDIEEANERISKAYIRMERSFKPAQQREIEQQGWTFMHGRQFEQLCRDQHANFPNKIKAEIESFASLDKAQREEAIWKRIERIARNIPDEIADKLNTRKQQKLLRFHHLSRRRRRRRQTDPNQWLSVLKPLILEPYMFTPVNGLSVLGPLILSPNLFSPLILAPSVLAPYVLSPAAPIPFILSPYVFGPFILSPMALAPFILNPYVLSPNVLNPFALAPLILSPTVLSPDILSPQVLSGAILSPTVGSPAVLTESYLMASVLSPSALS